MKNHSQPAARRLRAARPVSPMAATAYAAALLCASAAQAQTAPAADTSAVQTITISGIRRSLDTSLTLKRNTHGLVDGIVAEDIGKFPDTNLAESMQRISGVSIDRAPNGEGSKVTVRGVGPDYNMVLLNGRQMPNALINSAEGGASANSSRAFDFANLSPDAVAAVEVFKTSRASTPTGGIGATINIKTARPLDSKERVAGVSLKFNHDASNGRLPSTLKGTDITPEVSGIYSDTFADRTIGISITGNYSRRDSGVNKAYTQNGWHPFRASDDPANNWGAIPLPGQPGAQLITNRPTGNTLYSTPVELRYSLTGLQRERLNSQLTLQYAPSSDLKFTLDYTIADNKLKQKNLEISSWFNFAGGASSWTNGPVSGPLSYSADFPAFDHDLANNTGIYGQKSKNRSTGFNAEWKVSDRLRFEVDAHHSTANTGPDSPYGTYSTVDAAMFSQGSATAYYGQDFPVLSLPGTKLDASKIQVTGTRFDAALSDQKVDQVQAKGSFKIDSDNKLNFGLSSTQVKNRSAAVNHLNADWGGVGAQGDYPAGLFTTDNLPGYFSQIKGSNDPRLVQNFFVYDFNALRAQAIKLATQKGTPTHPAPLTQAEAEAYFSAYTDFSNGGNDWRTTEKSTSAYVQLDHTFDTTIPMFVAVGLRQESTTVSSSSQILSLTSAIWPSQNEIQVQTGSPTFGSGSGKYSYLLPSIDFDADITDKLKARASYGENIGRPGWGALTGGVSVGTTANFGGGNGSSGNPGLKPLLSKNLDFSLEFYYAKSSYVSGGIFQKKITNFVGTSTVRQSVGGVHTPIGGAYYNAAIASGCASNDPKCLRNYILTKFAGQPGVQVTGPAVNGEIPGIITALPTDPLLQFNVSTPSNQAGDTLKGVELNVQHAFGSSGFGVAGNYTYVTSGLKYKNDSTDVQSALVGVSNSYNLVGFYEDDSWSIRGAYNWRDKFLASTTDGAGNNPVYTAAYGQFDLSVGYKIGKNLTLQADFINLNDGVIRQYGRTTEELVSVSQTGRRYLVGARYKF